MASIITGIFKKNKTGKQLVDQLVDLLNALPSATKIQEVTKVRQRLSSLSLQLLRSNECMCRRRRKGVKGPWQRMRPVEWRIPRLVLLMGFRRRFV